MKNRPGRILSRRHEWISFGKVFSVHAKKTYSFSFELAFIVYQRSKGREFHDLLDLLSEAKSVTTCFDLILLKSVQDIYEKDDF